MAGNMTEQLVASHLVDGRMAAGEELGLRIDQTLTQDATGTLVMLEFEAMNLARVRTELSVQYVDHNLLQTDFRNADDHLFLRSACRKFGLWYSPPGNGVSHPLHMERFGVPGKTLLGSDSHTCAAGAMAMLAIGAGGLEVALAMAGQPFQMRMPQVHGVHLTGMLPDWVSAKDVILEMLRRHGVKGGLGQVFEYYGPGVSALSPMDRHVIANMGAELGATSTVFPSDRRLRDFLRAQGRGRDWRPLEPSAHPDYEAHDEIDLATLEPLIALPSSPGNVVPVKDVAGRDIYQSYIGSSANPGLRDFAVAALIVDGRRVHDRVSFDINPSSRQILENLIDLGLLGKLVHAGARIHQAGCNGCIGMGQAPANGRISLRTVPRNFPGRSGTREDEVYLCSPETAAASALHGRITDPRTLGMPYPRYAEPGRIRLNPQAMVAPAPEGEQVELEKGTNIAPLPSFPPLPDSLRGPVMLKVGDDVSTDEIMPAGEQVLPWRSNIPEISRFAFNRIDETFYQRAFPHREQGFFIVAGANYGQGSSREHAALAPRYLGLRAVIARSYARIHWLNLINFGIVPLVFADPESLMHIDQGDELQITGIRAALEQGAPLLLIDLDKGMRHPLVHDVPPRRREMLLRGGLLNLIASDSLPH